MANLVASHDPKRQFARAVGHPVSAQERFCILACAEESSLGKKTEAGLKAYQKLITAVIVGSRPITAKKTLQ